jgi:hypothetical protein
LQYGSSFGSPQARANIWSDATRGGPIPGSAICRRLINPVGFDKAKLPAGSGLHDGPARSTGSTGSANFQLLHTASGDYSGNSIGMAFSKIARRRQLRPIRNKKKAQPQWPGFLFSGRRS